MAATTYDDAARQRWVDEPRKDPLRTAFERDRARVLHSAALRRLAAKTQVVGPQSDDFVRNRLTHSLEVAQVARDLARQLGCDPDVVETAALAHDLGHPPFGHNGERALDDLAREAGGFEGNAQTLRILTRLEAKTVTGSGVSAGLNLTRATLDAATKYPWPRGEAPGPKFGVYDDDRPVFDWFRSGAPAGRRCVEAQVMDLSDDVAYSVHDVEDGVVAGRIDLERLADTGLQAEIWATAREWYLPDATSDELDAALTRLLELPHWPRSTYDGSRVALAGLKNLTSNLIGRFCVAVTDATQAAYGPGPFQRYAADLVVPRETLVEIVVLKGVAAHLVMRAEDHLGVLEEQRRIVAELVAAVLERAPASLMAQFRPDFRAASDDAGRLRVVVDQVAHLTDASALAWHGRL
jgi:dGTPase